MRLKAIWQLLWSVVLGGALGGLAGGFLYMVAALVLPSNPDGQAILDLFLLIVAGAIVSASAGTAQRLAELRFMRTGAGIAVAMGTLLLVATLAWVLPEHPERMLAIWALVPLVSGVGLIAYVSICYVREADPYKLRADRRWYRKKTVGVGDRAPAVAVDVAAEAGLPSRWYCVRRARRVQGLRPLTRRADARPGRGCARRSFSSCAPAPGCGEGGA